MHLPAFRSDQTPSDSTDEDRGRQGADLPPPTRPNEPRGWRLLPMAIVMGAILLVAGLAPMASAAHVDPTFVPDEKRIKDCTHFAPSEDAWKEIRLNPVRDGVYRNDDIEVTVSNYDAKTFDWTANRTIVQAVYVRGGATDASFLYEYDPAEDGDTDLTTPGEEYNEIQYASVCYAPEPGQQEDPCVEVFATAEAGPSNHVQWIPVEDADGYNVYRAVGAGSFELLTTTDASTLEHDDTDVEQGETYRYRVTATIDGDETDACNVVEVTAIPVFGTALATASAAVLGVGAYALVRRRR